AILFGGLDVSDDPSDDTYAWDGTSWETLSPATRPEPRAFHAMAFDYVRGELVMFGGDGIDNQTSDTWVFKKDESGMDTWEPRAGGPIGRSNLGMAWNQPRGAIVMFGGLAKSSRPQDTWEWNGTSWTQLELDFSPPGRASHALSSSRDGVLLFGGRAGRTSLTDTWELRYETTENTDRCGDFDSDRDGLVGCEDPDCIADCAPLCRPGPGTFDDSDHPIVTCAVGGSTCGDSTPDPRETCHTCPQDFGPCVAVCGDFLCDGDEESMCPGDCPPT
ncbi:MAG: hypothetical protein H0V17_12255, partial [Deltaproteobacteria bacterium]|nr:hypothetical protein [Deltaproteobacteria bacterium]